MNRLVLIAFAASVAVGCGYTKEEYQLQGDKLTRALAKQRSAETRSDEVAAEAESAKQRVLELEEKMRALGIDLQSKETGRIGEAAATLAERERALAEYRARAAKIDEARSRLHLLRGGLSDLAESGVEVRVRKNRLMIVLKDNLFNNDKLTKDGRQALITIAAVLKEDASLVTRDFQIAGHTDKKNGDTVGASLGRARAVLSVLVDPKLGGLDNKRFTVAGMGNTDPLGTTDSEDDRRLNRRLEIVLLPAQSEVLDLRALAVDAAPAKAPAKKEPPVNPPTP